MARQGDTQLQPTGPLIPATGAWADASADPVAAVPGWLSEGRYTYLATLGSGGMGRVYLVQDRQLLRQVALKIMHPDLAPDVAEQERFREEARAVSQLEHTNIVPLYDIGQSADGNLYYTMQYVKCDSLADVLKKMRAGDDETLSHWPFQKRAQALVELADALSFAHHHGVLHRDIKPANILVGERGQVLLTDWGISVRHADTAEIAPGDPVGTLGYVAPEGLLHGRHSAQSEVFSLGVVMYELLTLRRPFQGKTAEDVTQATLSKTLPAPDTLTVKSQGRVPRELAVICMRCLQRDPGDRFASMAEVSAALELYLHGVAPVVCVQTGLKRAIYRLAQVADNHGEGIVMVTVVLVVVPVVSLISWWLMRFLH